jgi:Phospholipid methyltransferase
MRFSSHFDNASSSTTDNPINATTGISGCCSFLSLLLQLLFRRVLHQLEYLVYPITHCRRKVLSSSIMPRSILKTKKGDDLSSTSNESLFSLSSIFWNKKSYQHVASEFHPYHKHDLNVLLHVFTTGLGVWGAIQLAVTLDCIEAVYVYAAVIALTTPFVTAALHTAFVYGCLQLPISALATALGSIIVGTSLDDPMKLCLAVIAAGYGLQDLAHWLCVEETMMSSYISTNPAMLLIHTLWLMPLVIDAVLLRHCYLPKLLVSRNRNIFCQVASRKAVEDLREWINQEIPAKPETTHLWPHEHKATDGPVTLLENDASIMAGFRKIFAPHHFDIMPVVPMNEVYVTAVGKIKSITSDAVFYTPHTDSPYWFLPGASLYRVLVGVTPNTMVRTRFNLQHESQDKVVDMYDVLGFDYNRELHWIDHVPGQINKERRSLIKLHFIVYPKGWHGYGKLCAYLNSSYNTWARGNFLKTLRPSNLYESSMAWWIWLTTWSNAMFEMYFGWTNVVYIATAYALGPTPFLILTSFRHYCIYMATFAYRNPPVAHGYLMRDAKLYKTMALMHLSKHLLPLVQLPRDIPGVVLALIGFSITILATMQLGMVRTYFGSELGFVKPQWISGFPYNTIPHPMIVGQLFAYSSILMWFKDEMPLETVALVCGHMTCYMTHMVQEMLTSSY